MQKEADWHLVKFSIEVNTFKLKAVVPEDPEESIMESYTAVECWELVSEWGHVLGVTKWKFTK